MTEGKNIDRCMRLISENCCAVHLVAAQNRRAIPIENLKQTIIEVRENENENENKNDSKIEIFDQTSDIETQVINALKLARKNNESRICSNGDSFSDKKEEIVIISGSLYIMKHARRALGYIEAFDNFDVSDLEFKNFDP